MFAKAQTIEATPAFVKKFSNVSQNDFLRDLKERGYTHCLHLDTPKRITVGAAVYEFRIMFALAFFKGNPPDFKDLCTGFKDSDTPLFEERKYYSNMMSVGKLSFGAILNGVEIKEWIDFFESQQGWVKEISKLI